MDIIDNVTPNDSDPAYTFLTQKPVNNKRAKIHGFELAGQHFFGETGIGVLANYTIVKGDVGFNNAADLGIGAPFLLPSVAAVVIGGTSIFGGLGGYAGTILGALILTVLDSLLTILNATQAVRQIIYGLIVLALAAIYARATAAE